MISISAIKTYSYCPLKLYFQYKVDEKYDDEEYFIPKSLKDLRIDIQDLFHKNLRKVKKEMELSEIEETLSQGVFNQFKATFDIIEEIIEKDEEKEKENENRRDNEIDSKKDPSKDDSNRKSNKNMSQISSEIEFLDEDKQKPPQTLKDKGHDIDEINSLKEEVIDEIYLNLKILSLKTSQAMKTLDKNGDELQSLFFKSSMYNYLIRDIGLDLIGVIDKIEVEKGKYYPVLLKTSNPPINGAWDGDRMEVIANALLIEAEFDTHITVGFIDYLKIAERRAVIIDTNARRNFFKSLTKINRIIEKGEIPSVKTSLNKCKNCEYKDLCENS